MTVDINILCNYKLAVRINRGSLSIRCLSSKYNSFI